LVRVGTKEEEDWIQEKIIIAGGDEEADEAGREQKKNKN
jgi:hypothetical protein